MGTLIEFVRLFWDRLTRPVDIPVLRAVPVPRSTGSRRRGVAVLAVLAVVATAAWAPTVPAGRATSEVSAPWTYREQVDGVTVVVDAYLASLHTEDAFVPLHVAVSFGPEAGHARVGLENFTLVDEAGNTSPTAGFRELARSYDKRTFDQTMIRRRPLSISDAWVTNTRVESNFFPATPGRTRVDRVSLAPRTWFDDLMYFPAPAAGLGGVLTLRLSLPDLDAPIEVRFEVPVRGG